MIFSAGAGLGVQFNDNILSSSSNRESDLIVDPNIYVTGAWKVSSINTLSLRLGVAYDYYIFHSTLGAGLSYQVMPGTEISFKARIGDVSLRFYERPSLQQSPQDDPTAPSGFLYDQFTNSIGISALWNLRDVTVQATFDHTNSIPFTSGTGQNLGAGQNSAVDNADLQNLRRTVDSLSSITTFQFRQDLAAGFTGAISSIHYTSGVDDGVSINGGVFCDKQLSNYTTLRISVGYQKLSFSSGGSSSQSSASSRNGASSQSSLLSENGLLGQGAFSQGGFASSGGFPGQSNNGDSAGYYGSIILRNRLNRYFYNSLSIGREADVSLMSNSVVTTYIRDDATLKFVRGVNITAFADYEYSQLSDVVASDLTTLHFGFRMSHAFNEKLNLSLAYEFISRVGSGAGETAGTMNNQVGGSSNFFQNRILLNLAYAF